MKSTIFVTCLLLSAHFSQAQWSNGSGSIYYNLGNVGIGTSSPAFAMDILATDPRYHIKATSNTSTPGLVMKNSAGDVASIFIDGSSSPLPGLAGF
jgi:hypothetical protein